MGLLDRLAPTKRNEPDVDTDPARPAIDPIFATKALKKFLACLTSRPSPVLIDLGSVVGGNVTFFGEQLGCKIFVEDLFADLDRFARTGKLAELPAFLKKRFPQENDSVDGILCWDFIDYLDRPAAVELANQLQRVLRPDGALLGFFSTGRPPREATYTKFVIMDDVNLKYRGYPAARGRQAALLNRDIIRLFPSLRVSDSFLLQNNLREILFRKHA